MEISEQDFIELFIKKHGKESFNKIQKIIIEESQYKKSNYIEISNIFYIAYAKYLGIPKRKMQIFLIKVLKKESISMYKINKILKMHNNSIKTIIGFIQGAEN